MLIKPNLSLYQVVRFTWKVDLTMLLSCSVAYYIDVNLIPDFHIPTILPTLMGTALAFFIGFNNNQAYDRWWEARTIWGAIVNDSRSWARSLVAYCKDPAYQRTMTYRHIAFLYALKSGLRKQEDASIEKYLTAAELSHIEPYSNKANAILDRQALDLEKMQQDNSIDNFRFLGLNELIQNFCDGMGKSERINNTVFPVTYIYFTKLFIWLFVVLITMSISATVGPWSILLGWLIGFVFHISHTNGMSLMNPFEPTAFGIPLDSITRTIEINMLQSLGETDIPAPVESVEGEYIM
jgi:putative membrane protein